VVEINRLLVRCAEDLIFFRDDQKWFEGFVPKNCRYRIEPVTHKLPHGMGDLLVSTHRILAQS
jgi:UDP-3-O-acyl-N-acetylglucosamine deacetylase